MIKKVVMVVFLFGLYISLVGASGNSIKFAVTGDFNDGPPMEAVSNLIKSWNVSFIVTTGDNNVGDENGFGKAWTMDDNVGRYYHDYIYNYTGKYGNGSNISRFFPSLGNHDWDNLSVEPYTNYFTLPGNERYYDFIQGPIHFFIISADDRELDGKTADSAQAQWLKQKLKSSKKPFQFVFMHQPPYSSGAIHGSEWALQWPFKSWGADAVFSGHQQSYERIMKNGIPFIVAGTGGDGLYGFIEPYVSGSKVRYNQTHGAILIKADKTRVKIKFINVNGQTIDTYIIEKK